MIPSKKKLCIPDIIIEQRLVGILEHIAIVEGRMQGILSAEDFLSESGSVIYDSILMRLQSVGENTKKIEELEPGFGNDTLGIEVNNIIRFSDLISHHYELMDTQINLIL